MKPMRIIERICLNVELSTERRVNLGIVMRGL
jgi:hypothetical protein